MALHAHSGDHHTVLCSCFQAQCKLGVQALHLLATWKALGASESDMINEMAIALPGTPDLEVNGLTL